MTWLRRSENSVAVSALRLHSARQAASGTGGLPHHLARRMDGEACKGRVLGCTAQAPPGPAPMTPPRMHVAVSPPPPRMHVADGPPPPRMHVAVGPPPPRMHVAVGHHHRHRGWRSRCVPRPTFPPSSTFSALASASLPSSPASNQYRGCQ